MAKISISVCIFHFFAPPLEIFFPHLPQIIFDAGSTTVNQFLSQPQGVGL